MKATKKQSNSAKSVPNRHRQKGKSHNWKHPKSNRQRTPQANRQRTPQANRQYKDRLFKAIFGRNTKESKQWRLDLYNALNGTDYRNPDDLKLTTIENVIYITMKNDISFLIGSQMNLYEQQSSYNPNMPLRGLMYFVQLYQIHLSSQGKDLLGSTLVKVPAPCYVVFYNGDREMPDESVQKLSDAFEPKGSSAGFEWTATVINIGGAITSPFTNGVRRCMITAVM